MPTRLTHRQEGRQSGSPTDVAELHGLRADLSTQVQLHMMAEVEFSEGSTRVYASTNYAGQYTQLGQEFEKNHSKVEVDTANNDSLCGLHSAGETLEDLIAVILRLGVELFSQNDTKLPRGYYSVYGPENRVLFG